jgi:hypothetical protein
MTRLERYYFLGILGGGRPIDYISLVQIGTLHLANPQNVKDIWPGSKTFTKVKTYQAAFERMLKEALENDLVMRVENAKIKALRLEPEYQISKFDWSYQISPKGDECLRNEQIERAGDYNYYKNFGRTTESAKKINPNLFK